MNLRSVVILFLTIGIFLRILLDQVGFGIVGSIIIYLAFLLTFICVDRRQLPTGFFYFFLLVSLLLIYSYVIAYLNHGALIYPIKPILRYLSYFMLFYICYTLNVSVNHFYKMLSFMLVVQFLVCLYQFLVLGDFRPNGTLQNNNHVNYLLVFYIVISVLYFRDYIKSLIAFGFLLFMGGLGGVISVLISFFVYGVSSVRGLKKIGVIVLSLIVFLMSAYMLQDRIQEQMKVVEITERLEKGQSGGDGGSLVWRVVTWSQHIDYSVEKNSLFKGLGIDTSSSVSPYSTPVSMTDPHNDYVLMIIDFGLFWTLIFISYLLFVSLKTYLLRNYSRLNEIHFYVLFSLSMGAFVGNIMTQSTLMLTVFGFFGCLHGAKRNEYH